MPFVDRGRVQQLGGLQDLRSLACGEAAGLPTGFIARIVAVVLVQLQIGLISGDAKAVVSHPRAATTACTAPDRRPAVLAGARAAGPPRPARFPVSRWSLSPTAREKHARQDEQPTEDQHDESVTHEHLPWGVYRTHGAGQDEDLHLAQLHLVDLAPEVGGKAKFGVEDLAPTSPPPPAPSTSPPPAGPPTPAVWLGPPPALQPLPDLPRPLSLQLPLPLLRLVPQLLGVLVQHPERCP